MNSTSSQNHFAALITQPAMLIPVILLVVGTCLFISYQRLSPPNFDHIQAADTIGDSLIESDLDNHDIVKMNLFGAPQPITSAKQTYQDIPETNLRLSLKGAFANSTPEKASALIAPDINGKAELFFIDAPLPGGAVLDKVYPDYVVIRRNGQLEKLQFLRSQPNQSANNSSAYDSYRPPEPAQNSYTQPVQSYNNSSQYQAAPAEAQSSPGSPVDIRALIQRKRQKQ